MRDEEFQVMIERALECVTEEELADAISVSQPSVERWSRGENLPHPVMRKHIAREIERLS